MTIDEARGIQDSCEIFKHGFFLGLREGCIHCKLSSRVSPENTPVRLPFCTMLYLWTEHEKAIKNFLKDISNDFDVDKFCADLAEIGGNDGETGR